MKLKNIEKLFNQLLDIYREIPFGNSNYQIIHSVINKEKSFPHRASRGAGLYVIDKLQNLYNYVLSEQELKIKEKQLKNKLKNEKDVLEKKLIKIELKRMQFSKNLNKKLIQDLLEEIKVLLPVIERVGKISKEEFEEREPLYFEEKFKNNVQNVSDALDSLMAENQNLYQKIMSLNNVILSLPKIDDPRS